MNMDQQLGILEQPQKVLDIITYILESLVAQNSDSNQSRSIFDSRGTVKTSLSCFIKRIFSFMKCSTACYIVALVLLDKLRTADQTYKISSSNVHKLIMTAILIAVKAVDDHFFTQQYYSLVAGLNLDQLNKLERHFLKVIEYRTFIASETFYTYTLKLKQIYGIYVEKNHLKRHQIQGEVNTLSKYSWGIIKQVKKL